MSGPRRAKRILWGCVTLAAGAIGGWAATGLDVPLPWMIGAMIVATGTSLAGLPIFVHRWARQPVVAVIGLMLGSSFTPSLLGQIAQWWPTIAGMALYVAIVTATLVVYFRRLGGFDRTTAYFAASPGGLNEMVIVGREMGGDDRLIALVHAGRLLFVILAVPFGFALLEGYRQSARPPLGGPLFGWPLDDVAIFAACAVLGVGGAKLIRLPAAFVLGPMFLSAAVHLVGWTESRPPALLVAIAQVVIGCNVGARFAGMALITIRRVLLLSLGSAAIMLVVTLAFAFVLRSVAASSFQGLILAFAPGGLAEMSLIAFALAIDAAFVAAHHVLRIAIIVVAAPLIFRRWLRTTDRNKAKPAEGR